MIPNLFGTDLLLKVFSINQAGVVVRRKVELMKVRANHQNPELPEFGIGLMCEAVKARREATGLSIERAAETAMVDPIVWSQMETTKVADFHLLRKAYLSLGMTNQDFTAMITECGLVSGMVELE
jgi:hypothetical protein